MSFQGFRRKLSSPPVRIHHCHCLFRKEVRHIMQEMSHTYSQSSIVSPKDFTDFLWWCQIILTRFYARTFCKILWMFKLYYTSIKNSFFESNYRRKNTFFNLFYILFSILQNKLIFSCKDQSKLEFVEKFEWQISITSDK